MKLINVAINNYTGEMVALTRPLTDEEFEEFTHRTECNNLETFINHYKKINNHDLGKTLEVNDSKEKPVLYVNGRTESDILGQIINFKLDLDVLKNVFNDYEYSGGLYSLIENMSKYFEVK